MGRGILLVQPPLRVGKDFVDYPYHSDLAVVQAGAVLREAGFSVDVIDAFAMEDSGLLHDPRRGHLLGAPVHSILEAARGSSVDPGVLVVAYSPFHRPPSRDRLLTELVDGLRAAWPSAPVLLADLYQGGQHYIAAAGEEILEAYPQVDCLLQHEAEGVLPDLCRHLLEEGRPSNRWSRSGGELADLSSLPVPAWDLVNLRWRDLFLERVVDCSWRGSWAFPIDGRTLPIVTSRGCPYDCAHCSSNPGRGGRKKKQRRHDPEGVRRLVASMARHGASRLHVLDEVANLKTAHMDVLLDALVEHELRFDFPNGLRADKLGERHLDQMAGRVATLSVSAESGAQRVVDEVVRKSQPLEKIGQALSAARARSIPTLVHYIIGTPGETAREINETLELALRLYEDHGAWPAVQYATPLPGTRLADMARVSPPPEHDWGPLFQHSPVTSGEDFDPDDLRWFKWSFEQRLEASSGPSKVILNVTYRCNNRCVFCAVGNRSQLDGDFERQTELLKRYRARGIDQLDIDGGEPTLYPRLVALVRLARELGYGSINLTTNGRRCAYSDYARVLCRSGLTSVLFSLHGADAGTHARSVGVDEAFDQTVEGVRNCVRHAGPALQLGMNVTVTRDNSDQLGAMAELAWSLGLRWLNYQFLTPFGRATRDLSPHLDSTSRALGGVIDRWRDRMKIQVINLPFCFMPGHESHLMGDLLKARREMVFVTNEEVNLHDYLKERRRYEERCASCRHRVFCAGFYALEDAPEAPWTFQEADVKAAPSSEDA